MDPLLMPSSAKSQSFLNQNGSLAPTVRFSPCCEQPPSCSCLWFPAALSFGSGQVPLPRTVLLHVGPWLGAAQTRCFFPLLLQCLQPQERQPLFLAPPSLPAHNTQTRRGGCADTPRLHNTRSLSLLARGLAVQHVGKAIQTLSLPTAFLHFFKQPFVAAGLPAHSTRISDTSKTAETCFHCCFTLHY